MKPSDLAKILNPQPCRKRRDPGAGKTLEGMVAAEQARPYAKAVLTFVRQEARRTRAGVIAVRGPCDAFGTIVASGRSIVFDMKECGVVTSFACPKDHVPDHQVTELVRHGTAGSLAGLLILRTLSDQIYWINWTDLVNRKASYPWVEIAIVGSVRQGVQWGQIDRLFPKGGR